MKKYVFLTKIQKLHICCFSIYTKRRLKGCIHCHAER